MLFHKKTNKNKFEFKFSTEIFAVLENDTAQTALDVIRSSKLSGNIFYCYATDREGKLVDVVPLRKLITAPQEAKISEIMIHKPVRLTTQCSTDIALEYFILYKFLAFPVVDSQDKLVGIARVNDFIEDTIAIEEKTEHERDDLLKIIGKKQKYMKTIINFSICSLFVISQLFITNIVLNTIAGRIIETKSFKPILDFAI